MVRWLGEVGRVHQATATRVEWEVDDFLSRVPDGDEDCCFHSPLFSLAGCEWRLRVWPKRGHGGLFFRPPPRPNPKTEIRVGIRRADGTPEGGGAIIFDDDHSRCRKFYFQILRQLRRRQSELVPRGTLTITCRVVTPSPEQEAPGPSPRVDTRQAEQLAGRQREFLLRAEEERKRATGARWLGQRGRVHEATATHVEWVVDDFLSFVPDDDEDYVFESPPFSLAGCRWGLGVWPYRGGGELVLYPPPRPNPKTEIRVAIQRADGTPEGGDDALDFGDGVSSWRNFDFQTPRQLRRRKSQLLPRGRLTITCRVVTPSDEREAPGPSPKVDTRQAEPLVGLDKLSSDFKNLLDSESHSDITVNVQGRVFRAHRNVLSARSPVLGAMYKHDTEESRTGILKIPDCDPDTFPEFLRYLYTGRIEPMSVQSACHLYATSEKYDVQELKSFCSDHIVQNLSVENVCDVVTLADRYGDDGLSSSAQEFFNGHFRALFLTSEWNDLVRTHPRLVNALLREMASASSSSS